jgi:hypothetical protein
MSFLDLHSFAYNNLCCFVELNLKNIFVIRINLWVKIIDFERSVHDYW